MKKYIWVAVVVAAFLVSPTNTHAQSSGTYDGCLPSYAYSPLTGAPCGKTAVAVFVDQTVFLQTGPNPVIYGSASGLSSIGLSLEDSGGGKSYGSGSIPIVNGRWSVVISPALAIGTYKIHIYDSNNQLLSTEGPLKVTGTSTLPPGCLSTSGYSTTTGQSCSSGSTSPSITVLNPNGGENWEKGETHRILWTSQGIDKVSLYVYNDSLYGSGSTNYLDPSGVSLSVPASQGYFDWTIPTNSFLPTPTTGNEGRYKIRIDGPNPDLTGVRDSSDNYFTITSPSSASNVSASIVGTPTLALTYNSSRKESGLTATFKVQVVTGSAAVQIHTISESVVVEDSVSEHSMYNGATLTPTTPLASDGNYFTIPANTKVQFNAIAGFDPSQMFAGSYSATFLGLSTPGQKIQAFGSKTNSLTIVGERSPYISSNQQVGSKLTLTGQRFLASIGGNPTVTTLYIDKTAFTTGVSVTPTTLTFTLPSFVNPGVHAFQIGNSTGKSNVVNINTTVQQDVLPSTASVSVTGTPTLSLTYDSALKESQLTANFNVSVTAGKTPMTLPTNSFFFVATAADNQNHTVGYSTATTEINSANGAYTIPAGTTRTFNLTAYFQPSMMFAGSYSVRLNSLTLDWNGHYLYPANKAYTNNITIIGERSPYITSISSPAGVNDVVTVTGVRFNSNDSIVIDGTPFFSGKGDLVIRSTSMTFTPSKFHLSNGPHAVVISDPVTGLSNSMGLILSGSNQTPASASVVGAPMLTLAYDSSRKESSLVSTFTISVTAGSEQILVSQNQYADLVYSDGTNSNVSATQSFQPITSLGTIADSGSLFYVLPAGTKAQFILKRTYNPKWMFAGTYRAYVSSLQTFAVGGTKSLYIPSNTTNNITVVGETSPYITSSQIVGSKLTLTGQRFLASIGGNPTMTTLYIEKTAFTTGVAVTPTSLTFTLPSFVNAGNHIFQISNATGASNAVWITVPGSSITQPSITVTSPNGGENWNVGNTYSIQYNLTNLTVNENNLLYIYLEKGYDLTSTKTGVNSSMLIGTTKDTQSFPYYVSPTLTSWPGLGPNYKIKICAGSSCSVSDISDNYFTLNTATPVPVVTSPTTSTATYPAVTAHCSTGVTSVALNTSVTYTPWGVSGGNGTYAYSWAGTDGLSGISTWGGIGKSYTTAGVKTATVTVTSGGQTATATCGVTVNPPTTVSAGTNSSFTASVVNSVSGQSNSTSAVGSTGTVTPNNSTCLALTGDLQYPNTDVVTASAVSQLQGFLNTRGYLASAPTGNFGLETFHAVEAFQGSNSVKVTGYVGALTRAKIQEISCK